jgi:hypothetical protein
MLISTMSISTCLPVGFAFGTDIHPGDTWEFQPTILFTLPVSKILDINDLECVAEEPRGSLRFLDSVPIPPL